MIPTTHRLGVLNVQSQASLERYASGSVVARYEAVLIMDSLETKSSVRSQAFSAGWSRLYQAGEYYVDLSLRLEGAHAVLMGHILPPVGACDLEGRVRLSHARGETVSELGRAGNFRLEVARGNLSGLEVDLGLETLSISDFGLTA